MLLSNDNANVLTKQHRSINYSFKVVVWPVMQGTKPDNKIFLRQNDNHLPVCAAVETNMGYCSIKHYLNLVVQFYLPIQVGS